jgi:glucosyl-dolichyl phosphate glucuronosyltransferase
MDSQHSQRSEIAADQSGIETAVDLTVVICTRDRPESLQRTLRTLATQNWTGSWDILIVDNGGGASGERACSAARDLPVDLRVTMEARRGLSFARNRALAEALGDAMVFVDDDVNCRPGWLAAHGDALRDPSVAGIAGRILPVLPESTPECFRTLYTSENGGPVSRYDFGDEPREITLDGPVEPPFGANMAVRRGLALSLGGFRTDLGWGKRMLPGEETELFRRILAAGGRLLYVPAAAVEHRIEPTRVTYGYCAQWWRGYGRASVLLAPPRGPLQRMAMVRRSCWDVAWYARELRRARRLRDAARGIGALQKRSESEGRLLELLGL